MTAMPRLALSSPVLPYGRGWESHLSTWGQLRPGCMVLRAGCSAQGGREGSGGADQELRSPQGQEDRAALEQGSGCPQPQWQVSHPLSVPSTGGDGVRALCQAPATLCPPAVTGRLSCIPWPSGVPQPLPVPQLSVSSGCAFCCPGRPNWHVPLPKQKLHLWPQLPRDPSYSPSSLSSVRHALRRPARLQAIMETRGTPVPHPW